ncbi:hypothetical protein [Mycobacterium lepromatosis]|nr:hypothetical protein [Mycobacterium lepromatosis]
MNSIDTENLIAENVESFIHANPVPILVSFPRLSRRRGIYALMNLAAATATDWDVRCVWLG